MTMDTSREHDPEDLSPEARIALESDPNADSPHRLAGGMGVSSERTGDAGDEHDVTHGVKATQSPPLPPDPPPEEEPGNKEENPVGIPPKAPPPEIVRDD